jgi:hypothetical protein
MKLAADAAHSSAARSVAKAIAPMENGHSVTPNTSKA